MHFMQGIYLPLKKEIEKGKVFGLKLFHVMIRWGNEKITYIIYNMAGYVKCEPSRATTAVDLPFALYSSTIRNYSSIKYS